MAVEFGLILLVLLPVLFATGEFLRLSLCDQALARATHMAAKAAGRDPSSCEVAVREAFANDSLARWLFDRDNDGEIGFVAGADPDGSAGWEVRLDIASDDGDLSNGVDFVNADCGAPGSWIRVRAMASVRVAFNDVLRQRVSWAVNQE